MCWYQLNQSIVFLGVVAFGFGMGCRPSAIPPRDGQLPENAPSYPLYRSSGDGHQEILYLFGDTALHKESGQNIDGVYAATYRIVNAHWVSKPDTVHTLGDKIDEVLVDEVLQIAYLKDKCTLLGKGYRYSDVGQSFEDFDDYESVAETYFVVSSKNEPFFGGKQGFLRELGGQNVTVDIQLLDVATFFESQKRVRPKNSSGLENDGFERGNGL